MEEKRIDEEDLGNLEGLASACIERGVDWRRSDSAPKASGYDTPEEMIAEFETVVRKTFDRTPGSHTRHLYTVHLPDGEDGSIIVCHTGNGPTSEAHARFFSVAPKAVLALVEEVRALRKCLGDTVDGWVQADRERAEQKKAAP